MRFSSANDSNNNNPICKAPECQKTSVALAGQEQIANLLLNLSPLTDDDNLTNICVYIYMLINVTFCLLSDHLIYAVISAATHCTVDSNLLLFNAFVQYLLLGCGLFIYQSLLCYFFAR